MRGLRSLAIAVDGIQERRHSVIGDALEAGIEAGGSTSYAAHFHSGQPEAATMHMDVHVAVVNDVALLSIVCLFLATLQTLIARLTTETDVRSD